MKRSSAGERWRRFLAEQERSGLSIRRFAVERGISPWSLYGWRQRLGLSRHRSARSRQRHSGVGDRAELVPVQLVDAMEPPASSSPAGFHVELRSGARIHVPSDFDATDLARLLAVLRPSC